MSDRNLGRLLLLYVAASLLHFSHNAEYLISYPNLPHWITRTDIYLIWLAASVLGGLGFLLYRKRQSAIGLAALALYATLGLGGLLHYTRAPLAAHSAMMNFSILFESVAATALLGAVFAAGLHQWRTARSKNNSSAR